MREHRIGARHPYFSLYYWYRGLLLMKRDPVVTILDTRPTREESLWREAELIQEQADAHGLLLNRSVYKKMRPMLGIPESIDTLFEKLIGMYFEYERTKKKNGRRLRGDIADAIDSLCSEYTNLTLWGYPYPWGWPNRDFIWKFPESSIDSYCVSR
jgi:hypothetical protein